MYPLHSCFRVDFPCQKSGEIVILHHFSGLNHIKPAFSSGFSTIPQRYPHVSAHPPDSGYSGYVLRVPRLGDAKEIAQLRHDAAFKWETKNVRRTVMAMAITYNWLFQWDSTFYKWGIVLITSYNWL